MSRKEIIHERLANAFSPQHLQVIDESDKHAGHAGHSAEGSHFAIVIAAESLDGCTSVEAHRKIYALFSDMMPDQIHALRICILPNKIKTEF